MVPPGVLNTGVGARSGLAKLHGRGRGLPGFIDESVMDVPTPEAGMRPDRIRVECVIDPFSHQIVALRPKKEGAGPGFDNPAA